MLTNLSAQLQTLQTRIGKVESDSAKVKDDLQLRLETFETGITKITEQHLSGLRQSQESHMKEVAEFIGPIRQAYSDADQATIVHRVSSLEDTCKSLLEKQNDALSQIKSISSRSIVNPTDFTRLQNTVKSHLDEQQKLTENFETRFTGLYTRLEDAKTSFLALPERGGDRRHAVVDPQSTGVELRLGELEKRVAGPNGIQDLIEQLKIRTEVNERSFVKILQEKFDSFEASTDEKLTKSSEWVTGVHEQLQKSKQDQLQEIYEVKQRLSDLEDTSAQNMSEVQKALFHLPNDVTQNLSEVQQSLSHLQNNASMETEHRKAAIEDIKQQLALKQDTAAATEATDNVKLAVRNLQAQYENISTDDLFQKMSGWILQQYPTSTADTLQQLATVRHDLTRVRSFTDSFTHIPNSAQALASLANLSSQIIALVGTPLGSIQSPETRVKYDMALSKMESFEEAISGLQRSLHTFESEDSPFVRKESWEQSMDTLQAHIDGRIEEELKARSALEHQVKATDLATQESIVKIETGLRECLETLNNIKIVSDQRFEGLKPMLEKLRSDTTQLRAYVDDELKDFNDDAKRECFNELPALFVHVTQLQIFVENLNQNSCGLEYKWACDFEKKYGIRSPFPTSRDILAGDP
ncbi:hypothetical protein E8E13_006663 [Curvularia kusanoi]|uniref:Uncharacterized protein n=1 Tax=Curvularia kusanoi TaxID=90978 RepID=A0A9P4TC83_CURKU|nr:hypothetical protein E8E13_006663 [Curvularia kusanoi]